MIEFFDAKFKKNKAKYILQCLLATLAIFIVLLTLDITTDVAIVAALGASSFIAFAIPHAQVSRPRFMVGGYIVGIVVGCLCHYLSMVPSLRQLTVGTGLAHLAFAALAVGLALFIMVVTNTEHPPAASLALGFALNEFSYKTVLVALIGIIAISLIKSALKPVLRNLL